ncbi:MAG: IS66 family insertion sequence element accessory protein TnpB [Lachnospiraceae bacterium]|jgi:transposase|nr:IS66 family insertion sequence element accessory protein TnpB [Lachnospiraceae bacterium]
MLKEAGGIRRVVLKTGRTDLRRGIDGLKAVISLNGMDPLEKGTLFLFCGRRNDRIRGLTFEGDGYLMITKRLSGQNRFQWPRNEEDMKNITMEQYRNLMEGFTIEGSIREL